MRVIILICLFAHLIPLATCAPVNENITGPVCPPGCECTPTSVRCTGVQLEDVLDFLLPTVRVLDMTDCDVDELSIGLLENATNLEQLHLTNCDIDRITLPADDVYDGFRRLRSINLSENELSDFTDTMQVLERIGPNAASIDLSANDFTVVNSTGDYSTVRTLNLSRNAIDTLVALPRSLQVKQLLRSQLTRRGDSTTSVSCALLSPEYTCSYT